MRGIAKNRERHRLSGNTIYEFIILCYFQPQRSVFPVNCNNYAKDESNRYGYNSPGNHKIANGWHVP